MPAEGGAQQRPRVARASAPRPGPAAPAPSRSVTRKSSAATSFSSAVGSYSSSVAPSRDGQRLSLRRGSGSAAARAASASSALAGNGSAWMYLSGKSEGAIGCSVALEPLAELPPFRERMREQARDDVAPRARVGRHADLRRLRQRQHIAGVLGGAAARGQSRSCSGRCPADAPSYARTSARIEAEVRSTAPSKVARARPARNSCGQEELHRHLLYRHVAITELRVGGQAMRRPHRWRARAECPGWRRRRRRPRQSRSGRTRR